MKPMIGTTRERVQHCLLSYGEDSVAAELMGVSEEDFIRIGERAYEYSCQPSTPSGQACCSPKQ